MAIFRSAIGDGAEYTLYSWRVRGVTIVDGEFGIAPQQKVLELIFLMEGKEATAFEDAKLLTDQQTGKGRRTRGGQPVKGTLSAG